MKNSGVSWLGEVPEHWKVLPNRALFVEVNECNHPDEQMLSVTINKGVIRQEALLSASLKKDSSNLDKSAYKLVQPGDIVYNKMRAWQGAIGLSDYQGIVSPAYVVQRPRNGVNPQYFHYLMRTPAFAKEAERWSYGITSDMWSLRPEHFKMIYICLPTLDEQTVIARFLNHYDRKIRRYIRAKQKLIKLLEEQKQAIIHRAVTCGLNPDAPLKPSGIPWLGEIPAHWEITPLKSVCTIQSGVTLGKAYLDAQLQEFPYLSVANVQAGYLSLEKIKTLRLPALEAKRSILRDGDVLMTEGGDPDKLGRGCVWNGEIENCLHQNHIFAVRPLPEKLHPQYLAAILSTHYAKNYFMRTAKQTTNLASTNKTTISQFRLPLPSIIEQNQILTGVAFEINSIASAVAQANHEISLIKEYWIRLTADIVTGKLDVHEAAAWLPEEQEEEVLFDEDVSLAKDDVGEEDSE